MTAGLSILITWLQFLLCAGVITFAGTRLTKYGDIIAEKTGLGRTWIGIVVVGFRYHSARGVKRLGHAVTGHRMYALVTSSSTGGEIRYRLYVYIIDSLL